MISRRAALAGAAAVGGVGAAGFVAHRVGVLDEGLRAAGIRPHREPDPRDVVLIADAAKAQRELLFQIDLLARHVDEPEVAQVRTVLAEQLAAVSDDRVQPPPDGALDRISRGIDPEEFADLAAATAAARAEGALSSGSLAVVKVLAAMSAGLEQVAVAVRRLA